MTTSAQGEDRSDFQAIYPWAGLDFGFCKSTEGVSLVDANFSANWANLSHAGIPRGAYHELTATAGPAAQAAFFVATVKERGLNAGDMLAIVASDYPVTAAGVRAALDETARLAGPHCPVLVYSDLSVGRTLANCTGYPLWSAWPNPTAPTPADVAPFRDWAFWQWGSPGGVDHDAFNGTAGDLRAWIATYLPKPPPHTTGDITMYVDTILAPDNVPVVESWPAGCVKSLTGLTAGAGGTLSYRWHHESVGWYPPLADKPLTVTVPEGGQVTIAATPEQNMGDVNGVQLALSAGAAPLSVHSA